MTPLLWWWRWWTGIDPTREQALQEARDEFEGQRARIDELAADFDAKDTQISALRKQAAEAKATARRAQEQLDETRREATALRSRVAELETLQEETEDLRARAGALDAARTEADQLRNRITELESANADADQLRARVAELESAGAPSTQETNGERTASPRSTPDAGTAEPPDVSTATEVLSRRIELDDLTVVEGIGPKIAGLLSEADVDSWAALADADVGRLREILAAAGPRYRVHDPSNWPAQAALLSRGQWREFRDLTVELRNS